MRLRTTTAGLALADVWRTFTVPELQVGSSGTTVRLSDDGTPVLRSTNRLQMLGGFFIFATVAFLGQVLFYLAFRRALPEGRLKLYAGAVLLLPSIVFWPSSIGKESLMLFFIGLAAFGVAGLFADYRIRWVVPIVAGLAGAGAIRLHVAALLAVAIAAATFLTRRPSTGPARARRVAMLGLAGVAVVLLITLTSETFGIDPSGNDIDPFLDEIQRRTQQGGSAVEGEAVRGIAAIPDATLRVLFRPLPDEANSFQAYLSALESVLILAVIVWRLPQTLRSFRQIRRNPYLLFSMLFVIGFVIAFSAIFNLGILARQRTQALPFLMALIVGMGWKPETEPDETVRTRTREDQMTTKPALLGGTAAFPDGFAIRPAHHRRPGGDPGPDRSRFGERHGHQRPDDAGTGSPDGRGVWSRALRGRIFGNVRLDAGHPGSGTRRSGAASLLHLLGHRPCRPLEPAAHPLRRLRPRNLVPHPGRRLRPAGPDHRRARVRRPRRRRRPRRHGDENWAPT